MSIVGVTYILFAALVFFLGMPVHAAAFFVGAVFIFGGLITDGWPITRH